MHVFLTGNIQVGKSTIIQKVIQALDIAPGGFLTGFGGTRRLPERTLYMNPAWEEPVYDEEHTVVRFEAGVPPLPDPEAFNRLGCRFLRQSRAWARLLVMDECGQLERNASEFQRCVLECLDQRIPVLGVLKKAPGQWLDQIRLHPAVTVIHIDEENRDEWASRLIEDFGRKLAERL